MQPIVTTFDPVVSLVPRSTTGYRLGSLRDGARTETRSFDLSGMKRALER